MGTYLYYFLFILTISSLVDTIGKIKKYRELSILIPFISCIIAFFNSPQWTAIAILSILFVLIMRLSQRFKKFYLLWIVLEFSLYLLCYYAGFKISFFQWGKTFIYFRRLSAIFTMLWLFLMVRIFRFLGNIKGMTPGIILIFTSVLFLVSTAQNKPLYFAENLGVIISSISVYMLYLYVRKGRSETLYEALFLGFLTGIVSITGVSKSVAFISLIFPSFFIIFPFFFIVSFIFYYYLRDNLSDVNKSAQYRIIWNFTNKRALVITYFIFLYLSVWIFTMLAEISPFSKLAIIFFVTIAVILLIIVLTIKTVEHEVHREKNIILGVPICNKSPNDILSEINQRFYSGEKIFIATPNAIALHLAKYDKRFMNILNSSTINIPDGAGVIWASDVLGRPLRERLTGVDFMMRLLKYAYKEGLSVYFLGASQKTLDLLKEELSNILPGLSISGMRNGYFKKGEEQNVIEEINNQRPDFLFVAMGMPKQEYWIDDNLDKLNIGLAIGVGGSFDVYAKTSKRAPSSFQKFGLEWAYRLLSQPKRIFTSIKLAKFVISVLKEKIDGNEEYS